MRALRVVGLTEDGEVVLEDPVRLERYTVPADERLRAAARGDLSRLGQIAIELESQLRPREIQARIRAGASVEQVATAAGVPEQKIERFAYPVLTRALPDRGQRPTRPPDARGRPGQPHPRRGRRAHASGCAARRTRGAKWDSWKGEDGRWVVALSWRAGRSDNRAHWVFQPGAHGGTVTALDEHASDLVEGLPARPLRTVGAGGRHDPAGRGAAASRRRSSSGGRPRPTASATARRSAPTRAARSRAWRPARSRAAAACAAHCGQSGTGRAIAWHAARRRTTAGPERRRSRLPRSSGVDRPPRRPRPAPAGRRRHGGRRGDVRAANRRTQKGKPVMPSWDEVLLGVRGPR